MLSYPNNKVFRDSVFDGTSNDTSLKLPIVDVSIAPVQQRGSIVYGIDDVLYTSDGLHWNPQGPITGTYTPEIGPNNQLHTIDNVYQSWFVRTGDRVTINVTYLISPTSTTGSRGTFSDVITLPSTQLPTNVFTNQFQVVGQITCNLGDETNNDYGHGVIFSVTASKDVEVFYSFTSTGSTQVFISVMVTYTL